MAAGENKVGIKSSFQKKTLVDNETKRKLFFASYNTTTEENFSRRSKELERLLENVLSANNKLEKVIDAKKKKQIRKGEASKILKGNEKGVEAEKEFKFSRIVYSRNFSYSKVEEHRNELQSEIEDIDQQLEAASKEYILMKPKKEYDRLLDYFIVKENIKENYQTKISRLKEKIEYLLLLKKKYPDDIRNKSAFHGLVNKRLNDYGASAYDNLPFQYLLKEGLFDSDEPKHNDVIRNMIKYMNNFEEKLENKQFDGAAKLVAQSPQGILINLNTFTRFKNIDNMFEYEKKSSPMMFLCNAVMITNSIQKPLTEKLSVEVIKCALKYKDLKLAQFWMQQKRFTLSINVGNALVENCCCKSYCVCRYYELALEVYLKLGISRQIVICYLHLHSFESMMKMAGKHKFKMADYQLLFSRLPSLELFELLSKQYPGKPLISLLEGVQIFLSQSKHKECLALLKKLHKLTDGGILKALMHEGENSKINASDVLYKLFKLLQHGNEVELAEELLACVVTKTSLENAILFCLTDYFS